jgi:isopenicillin-N epimerase
MMTPKGCAFLYARREAQEKLRTLIVSWGDVAESDSSFIREFEYQGTNDISAFLSVSAAIRFMRENSWDNVRTSCHELVNVYRAGMRGITGLPSLTPDTSEWYAQLSAHPMPPCDGPAFQRALFEEYSIEIPVMNGPNGEHYLRISVQGYNTRDDVDRLLGAVRALLPQFAEIAAS